MRNSQESLQGRGGRERFGVRDKAPSEHVATRGSLSALEPFSYCTSPRPPASESQNQSHFHPDLPVIPTIPEAAGGSRPVPVPRLQHLAGGILHEESCEQEQRPLGGGHTDTWAGRSKQRGQPVQRPRGGQPARTRQSRQAVRAGQEPQDWPASTVCLIGASPKACTRDSRALTHQHQLCALGGTRQAGLKRWGRG